MAHLGMKAGHCIHRSLDEGDPATPTTLLLWVAVLGGPSRFQLGSLAAASWVCTTSAGQEGSWDMVLAQLDAIREHLREGRPTGNSGYSSGQRRGGAEKL